MSANVPKDRFLGNQKKNNFNYPLARKNTSIYSITDVFKANSFKNINDALKTIEKHLNERDKTQTKFLGKNGAINNKIHSSPEKITNTNNISEK